MSTGKFMKSGGKLMTTYNETGSEMYNLIDDFYGSTFSMFKSAGAPTYATNGGGANGMYPRNGDAYFNAIMGKEITAAMFSTDNIYTAIGARPYNHEGVRIATELADYGLDSTGTHFVGLGAGTIQDGKVPSSVRMPVSEFRQPYKELPFAFDYGLGLQALEHKDDDTIQYKAYVEKMATNYSDLVDKTLLRKITCPQPHATHPLSADNPQYTAYEVETSLNGIARCIASGKEITTYTEPEDTTEQTEISPGMVSPYGGTNGDFHAFRGADYTSSHQSHTENNLDGNVIDLNNGALTIGDMKKLYRTCSINWKDSANPNNKVFAMSNIAQDKLGALMLANNVLLDTQYVQRDFNGVKSIPGRDIGLLVNTFQNIPIMQDGNFNFDFSTKRVSSTQYGDIMLLDLDHIWMSMLTPIEMYNVNNPAITGYFQEKNLMSMRAETRIDSFIQHGRIKNIADDTA